VIQSTGLSTDVRSLARLRFRPFEQTIVAGEKHVRLAGLSSGNMERIGQLQAGLLQFRATCKNGLIQLK
jgi:hypothetical protein